MAGSSVRLRSLDGTRALEFERPSLTARGLFRCEATLVAGDALYVAALEMITPFRHFWLEYFDDLAAAASGWNGEKRWSSEFGEVDVAARHERDEVVLEVTFRAPEPTAAEPSASIRIRPGDLTRIRDEFASFLRLA